MQQTTNKLIDKMNRVIKDLMKMEITDQIQKTLEKTFEQIKDNDHWKNATIPKYATLSFSNYESAIQYVGLVAMALQHFHGGYELDRIGESNTMAIFSKGYHHYMDAQIMNEDSNLNNPDWWLKMTREIDLNKLNKENIYDFIDFIIENNEDFIKTYHVKESTNHILKTIKKFLKENL